jgi:hypothetical protein
VTIVVCQIYTKISGVDVMIPIFCNFCPFFCEKNGRFSAKKKKCYDQIFAKTSTGLRKNANIFAKFFGETILKS